MANCATAVQYERVSTQLHGLLGGLSVRSPGEIGTLAYYCRCDIRDCFSDRTPHGTFDLVAR